MSDSSYLLRPPRASALIEALRDIGYSLESAISDIIDNSITAGAKNIDIRFGWDNGGPWIAVIDDGHGMSLETLLEAMRPGSRNPKEERSRNDLGRFGLGLKTASFSQCRRVTVLSRIDASLAALCWDLDHVAETDQWLLQQLTAEQQAALPLPSVPAEAGTAVFWQKLDRLELGTLDHSGLNERMGHVRERISLIFHRYLEGEPKHPKISIRINNLEVEPFDPFNTKCIATQHLPPEPVQLNGETMLIQPFVLPHHTKVSPSEYERLAGAEGYLRSQGFYVYRNRRLIIHGTWFRLARQEELTKLARVKIDIPNTLDPYWAIDVRKSRARPPSAVRQKMKQVIDRIRDRARSPYTRRAALVVERGSTPIWVRQVTNTEVRYRINLEHPVVQQLRLDLSSSQRQQFDVTMRIIAEFFPTSLLFSDYAAHPQALEARDDTEDLLLDCARILASANPELDVTELRVLLRTMEPFASRPEQVDTLTLD